MKGILKLRIGNDMFEENYNYLTGEGEFVRFYGTLNSSNNYLDILSPSKEPVELSDPIASFKPLVKFIGDMDFNSKKGYFQGWILPNGELVSVFSSEKQDQSRLVKLFMSGLQEHNVEEYNKFVELYEEYVTLNNGAHDIYESFAVESLGWVQITNTIGKRIDCRGEGWQDKYIGPFINNLGFSLNIANNGPSHASQFSDTYDNARQIINTEFEKAYSDEAARAR